MIRFLYCSTFRLTLFHVLDCLKSESPTRRSLTREASYIDTVQHLVRQGNEEKTQNGGWLSQSASHNMKITNLDAHLHFVY